ncbi:hypothetical protein C8T65DRAFT_744772 [Cerioporus squamosus]|nr:hypothetical protein C8T65DRAFT_744772 [Cerioporus squamosus]
MSFGTRISCVGVRHALSRIQDKVELIQDADAAAEKALVPVLMRLCLTGPEEDWLRDFSTRSSALNKEHRHAVKQALNNTGMLISFLYGNVVVERLRSLANVFTGRENAYKQLELYVSEMSQHCQTATVLHARVEYMYAAHVRQCPTAAQQNIVLCRTMESLRLGIQKLRAEEAAIISIFERSKPCFMLVCQKKYYIKALDAIHSNKIDQNTFAGLAAPIFSSLTNLCDERKRLLQEVENIFREQVDEWIKKPAGVLRKADLDAALKKYDGYVEKIKAAKIEQASVLDELRALENQSRSSPATLPGPDGLEVPIDDFASTFGQFEAVRFRSMRLMKLGRRIIADLRAIRF